MIGPRGAAWAGALSMLLLMGCGTDDSPKGHERTGQVRWRLDAPLATAFCDAQVDGLGALDTEDDYLPHVIACENGGADIEALKAQAVAARSVLYWTQGTHGSICNSQGCQVYSCNNMPGAIHYQAVDETRGQYLAYNNNVTYGFYVNGDPDTAPPSCVGDPGATNENWITYNEGLSGSAVVQTDLGFVHAPTDGGYGQNRGCQSQWGARCLESEGYGYLDILRFYYGDDIELLTAPGPCVPEAGAGGAGAGVGGATAGVGGSIGATSSTGGNRPASSSVGVGGSSAAPTLGEPAESSCSCTTVGGEGDDSRRGGVAALMLLALGLRRRRRGRSGRHDRSR
jgi:MYXO-CTERM domain-containing protein